MEKKNTNRNVNEQYFGYQVDISSLNLDEIDIDELNNILKSVIPVNKRSKKNQLKLLRRVITTLLLISPGLILNSKNQKVAFSIKSPKNTFVENCDFTEIRDQTIEKIVTEMKKSVENEEKETAKEKEKSKEKETTKEKRTTEEKEEICNRKLVLDNFSSCDTLEEILTRQEQLENIGLKEKDKIYKDCPLSAELQEFIYEQSIVNELPFDFLISIIHVETRGNFNSSGVVAYNAESHDLGLTQQNTKGALPNFMNCYNLSYEEAYQILKDNDYANVCSAFLVCKEISSQFDSFDPYEYAGCYNGWLNWKEYNTSREYVSMFRNAYDNIYTKHHNVEKLTKKQKVYKKKNN